MIARLLTLFGLALYSAWHIQEGGFVTLLAIGGVVTSILGIIVTMTREVSK